MFPPAPIFAEAVRLARFSDIPRIGVVAAASFYHSPMFSYERPYYDKYPLDTLSSYRHEFRDAIRDPDSIVLVVEASLDRREVDHVYGALAASYPSWEKQIPKDLLDKNRTVVSVASFTLLSKSVRSGQFQPEDSDAELPDDPVCSRDMNEAAAKTIAKFMRPKKTEAFKDRFVIDMMVTHPCYWRKGHATSVTDWFLKLSDLDHVGIGVSAAPMGKSLFESLGFKESLTVKIPGYHPEHPEPIYSWLGLRDSKEETDSEL